MGPLTAHTPLHYDDDDVAVHQFSSSKQVPRRTYRLQTITITLQVPAEL